MPKDFHGTEIKAGDVIALACIRRQRACLEQRFVREVHEDHIMVQRGPEEPTDKREIGRVTNFRYSIIIT